MKKKGTKVPLPHFNTLARWFWDGYNRGLRFMFVIYDPMQQTHNPVYCKKGEDIAKRFRSFYKDTSQIIVEVYSLNPDCPPIIGMSPRHRLETVGRHREVLGLTWDELGSHHRVVGRGNR